jgi:hypothetical protein
MGLFMFKKIIFSLLIATGFAAQGMDYNRRNDEKSLFESLNNDKDVQTIENRKSGGQVIDTVLQVNAPNKKPQEFGKSSLFVFHPKEERHPQNIVRFQRSKL